MQQAAVFIIKAVSNKNTVEHLAVKKPDISLRSQLRPIRAKIYWTFTYTAVFYGIATFS